MKCPYAQTKLAGDETYEVCSLNTKLCLLESGLTCDTYEEAMEELVKEAEEETNEEGVC